ncbi:protein of unknown function DUF169 [Methanococcus vannielii SB]|uniref:DUF169 domain-containing protein n=1 Tax=Methanococcus vannielii (strain ATCC 35089 / DSM 1224 / JCM 13029 / OCM 148 / SB) TaxID=406327 RepID=A6UQS3_METVS|nr:DUF169 domain-containing protein [Methanococcus vannielii]ABR54845.1 protein of unknown function DUF169 [Methanococcus vannielii SB]
MEIQKIKELGLKLQEILGLEKPATAVKLVKSKEEIPNNYTEVENPVRHCEMIQNARTYGKKFYATLEKQACKGGAYAIGILQNPPEALKTGALYYKLGNFETEEAAIKTVQAIPKVKELMYAGIYAPLTETDFEPDAIIVLVTPKKGLMLTQALNYSLGGRFQADFAGIQSLCADAVAAVKTRGVANLTLGCNGSRAYAHIKDEELVFSFPLSDLENVVNALEYFKEKWN